MKHSSLAVVGAVAIAAVLAPDAHAQDRRTMQMAADLRMLQEQTQQLQTLLQALTDAVKAIDVRVTQRIDQQGETTRKAFADQKLGIDALAVDVRVLKEKVDDAGVRIGSLGQEVDAVRQTVVALTAPPPPPPAAESPEPGASPVGTPLATDATPPAAPPAAAAAAAPAATPAAMAAPPPRAPAAAGASPSRMWDSAFSDFAAGELDVAILGFESYIKTFPTSESADDAQVTICQAYSLMGQYDKAVQACDLAIRTYPNGDALPDAYYRKGLALRSLKRAAEARAAFEYVLKMYPNSAAATLARQRLEDDGQR
jgi:TolA-binding protein